MTRLESSAFSLVGGGATVFVLSVVLRGLPLIVALMVIVVAVAAWSVRAPLIASICLGLIGWLSITGIDVSGNGQLRFSGWADLARVGLVVGAALTGAAIGRLNEWAYGQDEEQIWASPHRLIGDEPLGARQPEARPAMTTPPVPRQAARHRPRTTV